MAQWVKALVTKSNALATKSSDLSSIPKNDTVEGKN